jgi:hypothetical protein
LINGSVLVNKKVLISIVVVVAIGIIVSVIGLFHFLSKRPQSKEYLLAVSKGTFYRISLDGRVGEHFQEFNEKDINF